MDDEEIYECCLLVYEFLIDDEPVQNYSNCKSLITMNKSLEKHGFSMVSFTEYLNEELSLGYTLVKNDSYRSFFTNYGITFYKQIMRKYKVNNLINIK